MGDSEIKAVEQMLASGMQSTLDGFRHYGFSLTSPVEGEGQPATGITPGNRPRRFSF